MKRLLILISCGLLTLSVQAQDLPKPSPAATIQQRIGLTDVSIEYSRPAINDREIWGGLVPYGQLWRAGANKATRLTLSSEAIINGTEVPAGSYSLFIIPQKDAPWEVILNRNTELWGTGDYDEGQDLARFEADIRDVPYANERMEFRFTQVGMGTGELVLDWAGKQMVMQIESDPMEQVMQNIEAALTEAEEDEKWRVYRNAASFAEDANMTDQGLEWIKMSVKLKESWYGYWVYANLLAQKKDYKRAVEMATKALKLGQSEYAEKEGDFPYEAPLSEDIAAWKAMK